MLEHLIRIPCVAPGVGPRKALPAEEVRRVGAAAPVTAAHDVQDTVMIFSHQAETTRLTITYVAKPQQAGIVSVQLEGLVEWVVLQSTLTISKLFEALLLCLPPRPGAEEGRERGCVRQTLCSCLRGKRPCTASASRRRRRPLRNGSDLARVDRDTELGNNVAEEAD